VVIKRVVARVAGAVLQLDPEVCANTFLTTEERRNGGTEEDKREDRKVARGAVLLSQTSSDLLR
jgi:hypothetical protein